MTIKFWWHAPRRMGEEAQTYLQRHQQCKMGTAVVGTESNPPKLANNCLYIYQRKYVTQKIPPKNTRKSDQLTFPTSDPRMTEKNEG